MNVTNDLCAGGSTIGGLRMRLNGTPAANVSINDAVTGAGTVNRSTNAAHLAVGGGPRRATIGPR